MSYFNDGSGWKDEGPANLNWPSTPPKGFLKINDLMVKDVETKRPVGSIAECIRCSAKEVVSELGSKLIFFVCYYCRTDDSEWDFGADQPIYEWLKSEFGRTK